MLGPHAWLRFVPRSSRLFKQNLPKQTAKTFIKDTFIDQRF